MVQAARGPSVPRQNRNADAVCQWPNLWRSDPADHAIIPTCSIMQSEESSACCRLTKWVVRPVEIRFRIEGRDRRSVVVPPGHPFQDSAARRLELLSRCPVAQQRRAPPCGRIDLQTAEFIGFMAPGVFPPVPFRPPSPPAVAPFGGFDRRICDCHHTLD